MDTDYYEILGVSQSATKEEIKQAYRALSKKYHPDVNDAANAAVFFRLVEEAYKVLYNEDSRRAYDQSFRASQYSASGQGQSGYASYEDNGGFQSGSASHARQYRPRGAAGTVLTVLGKVILFPIFVVVAFFNKVLHLFGCLAAFIGWLIFGIGIIACVIFLVQRDGWLLIGSGLLAAFLGFVVAKLAPVILSSLQIAEDALKRFIFT